MRVRSPRQQDLLEEETTVHTIILAWTIPWAEEPGRLSSVGSHRVERDGATEHSQHTHTWGLPPGVGISY